MYFKKYFSPKKILEAISKVDVNFNELHVKFNMQSLKKTIFNWWKSEIW